MKKALKRVKTFVGFSVILALLALVWSGYQKADEKFFCEGLDPEACLLPWPSSVFLVKDAGTRTGFRVNIPASSMPINEMGERVDPSPWNRADGFSPGTTLIAEFASVIDPAPLPSWRDPGPSLGPNSPTLIVDVGTGERVAHFSEVESSSDVASGHTTLYLRPVKRLAEGHHYAVGIRGLRNRDGTSVVASAPFLRLRNRLSSVLAPRHASFEHDVFAPLATAGVARSTLLLAWDFRTASGVSAWGDLVEMRDAAFAVAESGGLGCSVASVVEDSNDAKIFRQIEGWYAVPNFLEDAPDGHARIARDSTGRPIILGTIQAPFTAIIPHSAIAHSRRAPVWVYGHGLFSDRNEVTRDFARDTAAASGAIVVATDFSGLSGVEGTGSAIGAFQNVSNLPFIMDRLRQSFVNVLLLPRVIAGECAKLAPFMIDGQPLASASDFGYFGNSLGGTFGSTLAALSPDIERFALGVGGINFSVMMPRATRFPKIELIFRAFYPRRIDRDLLIVMTAQVWDLVEGSFAPHLIANPLPGSPAKRVLFQVGLRDTSTANIASELAGRTIGLTELAPTARAVWGLVPGAGPLDSAYVVYDLGAEPLADGTVAPANDNGVHEGVRQDPRAQAQIVSFLRAGGMVVDTCGGACKPR